MRVVFDFFLSKSLISKAVCQTIHLDQKGKGQQNVILLAIDLDLWLAIGQPKCHELSSYLFQSWKAQTLMHRWANTHSQSLSSNLMVDGNNSID